MIFFVGGVFRPIFGELYKCLKLFLVFYLSFTGSLLQLTHLCRHIYRHHKKGDKGECHNYRPVSLMSNISKLLEKFVHEGLHSFFEKEKLFFEGQHGFRNKRSTKYAPTDITERIRDAWDKGYYACGEFLDFRKAFDTVNHEILLNKLTHYGIRGQAVNWFRSFLSQKVQYTSVCGFDSKLCLVTHGVPLGSVLRPLL